MFIKYHVTREIDMTGRNIETTIALMVKGIAKKDTFFGAKLKFIGIIWAKIRKPYITENLKKIIFRRSIKQLSIRCGELKSACR